MTADATAMGIEEFRRLLADEPKEWRGEVRERHLDVWIDDRGFEELVGWLRSHGVHGRFRLAEADADHGREVGHGGR